MALPLQVSHSDDDVDDDHDDDDDDHLAYIRFPNSVSCSWINDLHAVLVGYYKCAVILIKHTVF